MGTNGITAAPPVHIAPAIDSIAMQCQGSGGLNGGFPERRFHSSITVPSHILTPVPYAARPTMWAATGAVAKKNTMVSKTGATTDNSAKCVAAARTTQLTPTVPTFDAACIRVKRSGIRTIPIAAISMARQPVTMNNAVSISINAVPFGECTGQLPPYQ